ncbi:MAG: proline--tRNA ligase [Bacillota bacterium]
MRISKLFGRTLREIPNEAELDSHKLLLRAGMIKKLASGIYSYSPLAVRSLQKIMAIIRSEMNAIDGQEINMPVVQPAELWQESGRWYGIGPELARFKDRGGRDMVLGMTHEEVVTDLVRNEINSYRQLPFMLYQIQTKFRDEPRSRGGLIRVREFTMKDAYSFHRDAADLDRYYEDVVQAYFNVFERCGLKVISVLSDTGMMGGGEAHEFMYVTPAGEDTLLLCDKCGYAANFEVAEQAPVTPSNDQMMPIEDVFTPGAKEIGEVADFLGIRADQTMKTLILSGKDGLVLACIRGDLEINERKLKKLLGDETVRMATEDEARAQGLVPGYVSPVGVSGVKVVVDQSVAASRNLVAGANKAGFHIRNVNLGRDFSADQVADLVAVGDSATCAICGHPLREARGVEMGNTFKLGLKYSRSMGANYLDENGTAVPITMGCYGIGVGRLLSCVIEQNHDVNGIVWPISVAPYEVELCSVGVDQSVNETADRLYRELQAAGISVLYDDRDLRPGVKFNDADLLGMPIRVVASTRSLAQQSLEVKLRRGKEPQMIPLDGATQAIKQIIADEMASLEPER